MKRIEIEEITSYGFANVDDDETIAAAVALGCALVVSGIVYGIYKIITYLTF